MTVSYRPLAALFAAAAMCLFMANTFAQPGQPGVQPNQPGQINQPGQPPNQPPMSTGQPQRTATSESMQRRSGDSNQQVEQYLAQCLLVKNQGEVEIAQFAAQRSQNPQVKQFAQTLIEDHQAAIQRLQGIAGPQISSQQDRNIRAAGYTAQESGQPSSPSGQPGTIRDRDDSNDRTRNERVATTVQAGGTAARSSTASDDSPLQALATIERQVAERSQQALREKLQSKQGAEFDHCFVGSQVVGHMHMLAQLEVLQQHTSGPLRQIAQESQPKVKHHLEAAEQLAEQLMSASNR